MGLARPVGTVATEIPGIVRDADVPTDSADNPALPKAATTIKVSHAQPNNPAKKDTSNQ